jgi:hypothetical protein
MFDSRRAYVLIVGMNAWQARLQLGAFYIEIEELHHQILKESDTWGFP